MTFQVNIESTGQDFTVKPGESVLDAALREGLCVPYHCRRGVCGSCIATLLSGTVYYPHGVPDALSQVKAPDRLVLCQAHPESDLVIGVRGVAAERGIRVTRLPCRAEHLQRLSADIMRVRLKLPNVEPMQFLAGQYIEFVLKDGRRRAFSIANAPHQDEYLELHIRRVPGGSFTGHVFDEMRERALLRIEGPLGSFYLREDSRRPVLMVGGGTGFAPLKGMLEHVFYIGFNRPMHLFRGVRGERDLYLDNLPRQWEKEQPDFRYTAVLSDPVPEDQWQGAVGLVNEEVIEQYPDLSGFDIYMSGPPAMIEVAIKDFIAHGAQPDHMYFDAFEFAMDVQG